MHIDKIQISLETMGYLIVLSQQICVFYLWLLCNILFLLFVLRLLHREYPFFELSGPVLAFSIQEIF